MSSTLTNIPTRTELLDRVAQHDWDLVVIGGGATGLGTAVDASSRGYKTLLLEAKDFAQATSSRSTKLIHGGVRYLRQGNVSLVRESLLERGLLLRNAPGLVHPLEFVIPTRGWMETAYYATGLKVYDMLSGTQGIRWSRSLSRVDMVNRFPTLHKDQMAGGVSYFDAGFDDARLAIALMQTIFRHQGAALNHMPVSGFQKLNGRLSGVIANDAETGREYSISARAIVNACGIFCDQLRTLDRPDSSPLLTYSQGTHLVVDREYLPGSTAIIVPETEDGRVLFFIPWQGSVMIGTTDIPVAGPEWEPRYRKEEIDYLLDYARRYLNRPIDQTDIRSVYSGLRPLVRAGAVSSTSQISRDHKLDVSTEGLITITGGKWTTFRRMAQDTVDRAIVVGRLERRPCQTANLPLTLENIPPSGNVGAGLDATQLDRYCHRELARTVEDVLARRTRLLFLDARRAIQAAPAVAVQLASLLGRDEDWVNGQIRSFNELASGYLVESATRRDRG